MSNQLPPPGSEPAWRGGRDMHETDPDIINSQIEAARGQVPLRAFLNNFELNLPVVDTELSFKTTTGR